MIDVTEQDDENNVRRDGVKWEANLLRRTLEERAEAE